MPCSGEGDINKGHFYSCASVWELGPCIGCLGAGAVGTGRQVGYGASACVGTTSLQTCWKRAAGEPRCAERWVPVLPAQPLPVAFSAHPKCPWSCASSWICQQRCFLRIQLWYRGCVRCSSRLVAWSWFSPHQGSLLAVGDAGVPEAEPGHSTKPGRTVMHMQKDEREGPSFWCLTASELFSKCSQRMYNLWAFSLSLCRASDLQRCSVRRRGAPRHSAAD